MGLATLLSEVLAVVIGLLFILKYTGLHIRILKDVEALSVKPMMKMLKVNKDLFIRTACLLTVFAIFTSTGASMGENVLAANAILFQIHLIMAYFFDGLANASSILSGKAVGARDEQLFNKTLYMGCLWSTLLAVLLTIGMAVGGSSIISLFTNISEVQEIAVLYGGWIVWFPIASFASLQLYGFYIGTTQAAPVRNSLIISLIVFLLCVWVTVPLWGNHGLWLSFLLFTVTRSMTLWIFFPQIRQRVFRKESPKVLHMT